MKFIFTFIFILSLTAGGAFGYYSHFGWIGYTISFAVSGFLGSSIIAVLFSYLYFFQRDSVVQGACEPDIKINHHQEVKRIKE